MQTLTSTANPNVRRVHRLQRQSRQRRETGQFCVETLRDLGRAVAAGIDCVELYALADQVDREPALASLADRVDAAYAVTDNVLAKLSYRQNPEGFVALMAGRPTALGALPAVECGCYLVCAGLEKPGNLGAILRSADAAGCDGVLIDSPDVDLFNPNCIRASTGAVFSQPVGCGDRDEVVAWLRSRSVTMIAATPEADRPIDRIDLNAPVAWLLGSEAEGLAADWRAVADASASIPMAGRAVDSLNVSVTAALLLYETMRQRRA